MNQDIYLVTKKNSMSSVAAGGIRLLVHLISSFHPFFFYTFLFYLVTIHATFVGKIELSDTLYLNWCNLRVVDNPPTFRQSAFISTQPSPIACQETNGRNGTPHYENILSCGSLIRRRLFPVPIKRWLMKLFQHLWLFMNMLCVLYKTFRNFINSVTRLDYRGYGIYP